MKIVFIGCVNFSAAMLDMLSQHPDAELVGVITREHSSFNADFHGLSALAEKATCPLLLTDTTSPQEILSWLRQRAPDVIYCLGWSSLLSTEILATAPLGAVGYHPAALPKNRGRHPIIWALALGLKKTASTFFLMEEEADSGDILSQVEVDIESTDDAGSLYRKLVDTALPQLHKLTTALANGTAQRIPQDHRLANSWRKRVPSDGRIDWRMSSSNICNLIRALAPPYPGAHCLQNNQEIRIWRAHPAPNTSDNIEPGKVLDVSANRIRVKCGDGAVELTDHEFEQLPEKGTYL